eukprot:6208281-Pleurochrysis_carterae.AAC.3
MNTSSPTARRRCRAGCSHEARVFGAGSGRAAQQRARAEQAAKEIGGIQLSVGGVESAHDDGELQCNSVARSPRRRGVCSWSYVGMASVVSRMTVCAHIVASEAA